MKYLQGYEIGQELRRGSRSVWLTGVETESKAPVIIKHYPDKKLSSMELALLRYEFEIIKKIDTENIQMIRSLVGESDGNTVGFAVIYDYAEGISLGNISLHREIDLTDFLDIACRLTDGLIAIHSAGTYHGSIKPSTVTINPQNLELKIGDFGFPNLIMHEFEDIYNREVIDNALPYISPEQTGRSNILPDYRTDFYSLGITLYELLTGKSPFTSDDPLEIIHSHLARRPIPPLSLKSGMPESLSDIIIKLLSKNPESRYQSAQGLKSDLSRCLERIRSTGRIDYFPPGENDLADRFRIPDRVYGRDREIGILMAAFHRVRNGLSEVVLVKGGAGIGKTVMVKEIHRPVAGYRGLFASEKFDRLMKNMPYSALVSAFRGLLRQILAENEENLARWKNEMITALGRSARIITDMIPEAELLIGRQPEVQQVGPEMSQNRFNLLFLNFAKVFAKRERPLVLYIDDLQWADSASLDLLRLLIRDPEIRHVLFILSVRDPEIEENPYLSLWLDRLRDPDVRAGTVCLGPLDLQTVNRIIADTIKCEGGITMPLSEIVLEKTGGNPFFVKQFLKMLHDERLILFETSKSTGEGWVLSGSWKWNIKEIRQMQVTDNVVDLMKIKINRLGGEERMLLKTASAIGNIFDLETLAVISVKDPIETLGLMEKLTGEGLIIMGRHGYRFAHDRIQEAAYSLLSDMERKDLHFKIGEYLLNISDAETVQEKLFTILDNYNCSLEKIGNASLKLKIAELNLAAGKRAKSTNAYASALRYLNSASSLAEKGDSGLRFRIMMETAECNYLTGDFAEAENIFNMLLGASYNRLDRAKIYSLKVVLLTNQSEYQKAVSTGIVALKQLGVKLNENPGKISLLILLLKIKFLMGGRDFDELVGRAELTDPESLAAMDILSKTIIAAYFSTRPSDKILMLIISMKMLIMTLKKGNTKYSSFAYTTFAIVTGSKLGNYRLGYEYGRVSIALNDRFNNLELKPRVYLTFGSFVSHWARPVSESLAHITTALHSSFESGDLLFASFAIVFIFYHTLRKGENLHLLIKKLDLDISILKKIKHQESIEDMMAFRRMLLSYTGKDHADQEPFNEEEFIGQARERKYGLYVYYYTRIESNCIFGRYGESIRYAMKMMNDADDVMFAGIHIHQYYFYFTLALTSAFDSVSKKDRRLYRKIIRSNMRRLRLWSDNCPENFLHQRLLMEAELDRIEGRAPGAMDAYNRAISECRKNGYTNHEAIACETAGRFYISAKNNVAARALVSQAVSLYREWGATAKADALISEHRTLLGIFRERSGGSLLGDIDYMTIVNSLQAISSVIILEELLKKLMKIVMENAGAERGLFITIENNRLIIRAEMTIESVETAVTGAASAENRKDLLAPVINYVKRTGESVVIDDARMEKNYSADEYVIVSQPVSILCLPVIRQTNLVGILYLENNMVAGAFTPERIEVLKLIASQAAISLENAILYNNLTREINERKKVEEALRESEDKYRLLVESMNEGLALLDTSGRIIYINSRLQDLLEHPREEFIGHELKNFTHPDDHEKLDDELKSRRSGKHAPYELRMKSKSGTILSMLVSPRPIFDDNGSFIGSFGIFTDITDRKKLEEEMLKSSKLESLGIFAGGIAHDFNNLLTAIIGNISLARMLMTSEEPYYEILFEAEKASLRARDLTQQLLTFSRGGAPIKKTSSVKDFIRDNADFLLSGSNVVCKYDVPDGLWNVDMDEGQILQVIHNLIINASQAMPQGGEILVAAENLDSGRKRVLPEKSRKFLKITVKDSGTGIPKESIPLIFDPYYTTKEKGTGLGLTVAYSIIKKHDGYITVDSEIGKGTIISVFLPASDSPITEVKEEASLDFTGKGRILLMDDEEIVLKVLSKMLSHIGFETELTHDGAEAISCYREAMAQKRPFDLVIMDLTIPGKMGGKETIAQLREIDPGVKAVVSSGYSNDPVMANYSDHGFIGIVAKPYRIDDIKNILGKIFGPG
jgi:PAS domain S-box-containing protein